MGEETGDDDAADDDDLTEECGGAEDGVIEVPADCPELGDALDLAEAAGPGIEIRVSPGEYDCFQCDLTAQARLVGDDADSPPTVLLDCNLEAEEGTSIADMVFVPEDPEDSDGLSLHGCTVERVSAASIGLGDGAELRDVVVSGSLHNSGASDVWLERVTTIGGMGDLTLAGNSTVLDTDLDHLRITAQDGISAEGVVSGVVARDYFEVWADYGPFVRATVEDSEFGGLSIHVGTDSAADVVVRRTRVAGGDTGLYLGDSEDFDLEITNCLLTGSDRAIEADWRNGRSEDVDVIFHNNVVVGDVWISSDSGCDDHGAATWDVRNNIFAQSEIFIRAQRSFDVNPEYNMLWDSYCSHCEVSGLAYSCEYPGYDIPMESSTGTLLDDPSFWSFEPTSPESGDYRLVAGSPAIDAGDPATDYDDPDGSRNDMGLFGGPHADETGGTEPGTDCADGVDNDGDGWIDYVEDDWMTPELDESLWGDPGCASETDGSEDNGDLGECADGVDNDGDGAVDGHDPECSDAEGIGWAWSSESPACSNGIDDDGDGLIDYPDDPECDNSEDPSEYPGGCENGLDDDGDGWSDEDDPDCYHWGAGEEIGQVVPEWACADGVDNDGDGWIDGLDPGCSHAEDDSEAESDPSCSDGVDNDGDGWIDFDDPTCVDGYAESLGGGMLTQCHNGVDDDGDGLVDGFDPECSDAYDDQEAPSGCQDGMDNDGDGWVDVQDPDCYYWGADEELGLDVAAWACADGNDNDGDGFLDGHDPGCDDAEDADESDPHATCIDAVDNDGDGWIDLGDPDCVNGGPETGGFGATECNDGSDNDGDGSIDAADPDCTDGLDDQEQGADCADGADNDGDCWADADDPDCYFYGSNYEMGLVISAQCGNQVDDDGDGFIDGCDPDCTDAEDTTES